jgi:hypothetical protein
VDENVAIEESRLARDIAHGIQDWAAETRLHSEELRQRAAAVIVEVRLCAANRRPPAPVYELGRSSFLEWLRKAA